MKTITVAKFIEHLYKNGNFQVFGEYIVKGNIVLPKKTFTRDISLGRGTFKNDFHCGDATFKKHFSCFYARFKGGFYCDDAKFDNWFSLGDNIDLSGRFYCGNAKFNSRFQFSDVTIGGFNCENAFFKDIYFSGSTIGEFDCGNAVFEKIYCYENVTFKKFLCQKATFPNFDASRNYALGMVIHHYKTSGVAFSISDFQKIKP